MYTKARRWPTSSLVKVYSDVPADTNRKSLRSLPQEKRKQLSKTWDMMDTLHLQKKNAFNLRNKAACIGNKPAPFQVTM